MALTLHQQCAVRYYMFASESILWSSEILNAALFTTRTGPFGDGRLSKGERITTPGLSGAAHFAAQISEPRSGKRRRGHELTSDA